MSDIRLIETNVGGYDYFAPQRKDWYGFSTLENFAYSPRYCRDVLDGKVKTEVTPAMQMGSLVDALLTAPKEDVEARYRVYPGSVRRGKMYDEFVAENPNSTIVTIAMWGEALEQAAAAKSHPELGTMLNLSDKQVALYFARDGIQCKLMMDLYMPSIGHLVDLKRSGYIEPDKVAIHCIDQMWLQRQAWYVDNARACGYDVQQVSLGIIHDKAPYQVEMFDLTEEHLQIGRYGGTLYGRRVIGYLELWEKFRAALDLNHWPGMEAWRDSAGQRLILPIPTGFKPAQS